MNWTKQLPKELLDYILQFNEEWKVQISFVSSSCEKKNYWKFISLQKLKRIPKIIYGSINYWRTVSGNSFFTKYGAYVYLRIQAKNEKSSKEKYYKIYCESKQGNYADMYFQMEYVCDEFNFSKNTIYKLDPCSNTWIQEIN